MKKSSKNSAPFKYTPLFILILFLLGIFFAMSKQQQVPTNNEVLIRDLKPLLSENNSLRIKVIKTSGNYVSGQGGFPSDSGFNWIAKSSYGNWSIIWKGVNIISCKIVRENSIPKDLYDDCSNNY